MSDDAGKNTEIAGIDVSAGLKTVMNKSSIYLKLLASYKKADHAGALEAALRADNLEDAILKAHSLKGVCANLRMNDMQDLTKDIELELKNGSMTIPNNEKADELADLNVVLDKSVDYLLDNPSVVESFLK